METVAKIATQKSKTGAVAVLMLINWSMAKSTSLALTKTHLSGLRLDDILQRRFISTKGLSRTLLTAS